MRRSCIDKEQRLIVTGVNMMKRHRRQRNPQEPSAIIEIEAPLHVSNVKVVCRRVDKPSRVGFSFLEDGRKVRVCKNCNEAID